MTGELGHLTSRGEYEALKSISPVCRHAPEPYGWGTYITDDIEYSYLLVDFLNIKMQVFTFGPFVLIMALDWAYSFL